MADRRSQDRDPLRRPKVLDYIGAGGMVEEEARETARELVRNARAAAGRHLEGPAPDPDAVRKRREALQHNRDA